MVNNSFWLDNQKKSKESTLKIKLASIWAAITFLVWWCNFNPWNEKNFAEEYDAEWKLMALKSNFEKVHPIQDNVKVKTEEIINWEKLWNKIFNTLITIPWINNKVIIIDIESEKWLILNNILKNKWFNTTYDLFINWSWNKADEEENDKKLKDAVDYSRMFSVLDTYRANLNPDMHFIEIVEWKEKNTIHTMPWTVIIDKNRLPENIVIDDKTFFNNAYTLEDRNLPEYNWFLWEDKIRDGIIFISSTTINPDIKEWLDTAAKNWINTQYIAINNEWTDLLQYYWKYGFDNNSQNHITWINWESMIPWLLLTNNFLNSNINSEKDNHHSWWWVVVINSSWQRAYSWWGGVYIKSTNVKTPWGSSHISSMSWFKWLWWKWWSLWG